MSDHGGRVHQFKRRWHEADKKGLGGSRTTYALLPLLEALDRAGAPPAYTTLSDIARELQTMKEQGMTRESIEYALNQTFG